MSKRKRIALDCDGVMYDFQGAFIYMANHYLGANLGPKEEWWTSWYSPKEHLTAEQYKWMWNTAPSLGLFRYGHIIKGAVVGCAELANEFDLVVVTHRGQTVVNDTLDFLRYMAGNMWQWSGVHILTKEEPKESVDADILVDDKPENLIKWAQTGRQAIRFAQPWNNYVGYEGFGPIVVARDWKEVVARVRES